MDTTAPSENELKHLLHKFLLEPCETEVLEFKSASNDYNFDKLGKYFSALSNEANIRSAREGWMIFGVDDKRKIIGTRYRDDEASLNSLRYEMSQGTGGISFRGVYEMEAEGKRVLMLRIPAAVSTPTLFKGHAYGRDGESLHALSIEKIDMIRRSSFDWSSEVVEGATLDDLSVEAIRKARDNYKQRNPGMADDCDSWDDRTFLNKAKILKGGKITNTALILLGKDESEHFIGSSTKIRWKLIDRDGRDKDFAILGLPMLISMNIAESRIRNYTYRFLRADNIAVNEMLAYEPSTIRESISNSVAHQDYMARGYINLIESEDGYFEISNLGSFLHPSVESVVSSDLPNERYRNPFLVAAMFGLGLVDTVGGGIRKMFENQAKRFFPLPEYDISDGRVGLRIYGRMTDRDYSQTLAGNTGISIEETIMLDKIRKGVRLDEKEVEVLRKKNLVKGRSTMLRFSYGIPTISDVTVGGKSVIVRIDLKEEVLNVISSSGPVSRADIGRILSDRMQSGMTDTQKRDKISNVVRDLCNSGVIKNVGSPKRARYVPAIR
ncbi:MAG: putative DNA binding domain-containing protein [Methanomassiliicoccaceae archaeon]|nr:putative DNA binding domain-containing protein [Methanomassiliicoccaceae archaeon]